MTTTPSMDGGAEQLKRVHMDVMGWTEEQYAHGLKIADACKRFNEAFGDAEAQAEIRAELADLDRAATKDRCVIRQYLTSVADDHTVLAHVRTMWSYIRLNKFALCLERIWGERDVQERDAFGLDAWPDYVHYQPGDYSRAALSALSAVQGKTQ